MGKYRNRIEALEQVFVREPSPAAIQAVRRRVQAGKELTDADIQTVQHIGVIACPGRDGDAASVSSDRSGQVVVHRIVGIAYEDV